MIIKFDTGFAKSVKKEMNPILKKALPKFIDKAEKANNLNDLASIKKIKGHDDFYRYRTGENRIGFKLIDNQSISLIIVAKRSDIYNRFP